MSDILPIDNVHKGFVHMYFVHCTHDMINSLILFLLRLPGQLKFSMYIFKITGGGESIPVLPQCEVAPTLFDVPVLKSKQNLFQK